MHSDDDDATWDDVTTTMPKVEPAPRTLQFTGAAHEIVDEPTVELPEDQIELADEDLETIHESLSPNADKPPPLPFQPASTASAGELEAAWTVGTELLPSSAHARLDKQPALPFRPSSPGVTPTFDVDDDWSDHTKPLGNVLVPPRAHAIVDEQTMQLDDTRDHRPSRPSSVPFVQTNAPSPSAPPLRSAPRELPMLGPAAPTASLITPASTTSSLGAVPELEPVPNLDRIRIVHEPNTAVALLPWLIDGVRHMRTLVVKWTGDLVFGAPCTMRATADALHTNVFRDGDAQKSLVLASDFAPRKNAVDVTLVGHAYAPGGAAEAALVGFHFGKRDGSGFERKMMVFGERQFERVMDVGTGPGKPLLFRRVPLIYELALGGIGSRENPMGLGRDRKIAPQLEDPERLVHRPQDAIAPMCFAAVSPHWPVRHTAQKNWGRTTTSLVSFTGDFDWTAYQAAPKPQRIAVARGDETFLMSGMHAERTTITGQLPGQIARCFIVRQGELREIEGSIDTIDFDMDALDVNVVWRGSFEVRTENATDVEGVFVMMEPSTGSRMTIGEVEARYRRFVTR